MKIIKPKKIEKGSVIAIVSPSSTIIDFKERTDRAVSSLEARGYKVVMMPNSQKTDGYSGGDAEERASDINNAFMREDIDIILCSTGGITANAILPFLDYELIRKNPKIFCGFSDITTLNLMITSETGMVTFNGPTLLPSFGEFEGAVGFTFNNFEETVRGEKKAGSVFPVSNKYAIDNLF
jgi:muramoyltetrapeptide carboxypeptidase